MTHDLEPVSMSPDIPGRLAGAPAAVGGRVAVVDPYSTGAQIAAVLAERGVETVAVLATRPFAATHRARLNCDEYLHVHTYAGDIEATGRILEALGVGAVMAGCESGVVLADQLARALKVRGNDPATSGLRREKYAMAEALRAFGLSHPRTIAACSVREARRAAQLIGSWPVVVKPLDSAGSDQVTFARTMAEVVRAASAILASNNIFHAANEAVICQQYLAGRQFAVNTVSRSSAHRLVEVWADTRTGLSGNRMIYDRMDLVAPGDPRVLELYSYVNRCLDALGIDEGPAHSEVMLTEAGPVLIETGARVQGGDSVALMRAATGTSHTDAAVEALLGGPAPRRAGKRPALYPYRPVTQLFLQAPPDAMVAGPDALERLLAIPGVTGLVSPLHPGTPVAQTIDLLTSPGTVYLTGRERKAIESAYERVRALEADGLYVSANPAGPTPVVDPVAAAVAV